MTQSVGPVVIIGAGAAGVLAAIRAAESGQHIVLLEKNTKPGVKILMSGGTRCNITQNTDCRGIAAAFGRAGKFLHSPLAAFGPADIIEMLNGEGVATKVEPTGKIFPASDRALDVRDALLRRLSRSKAHPSLSEPALKIERVGDWQTLRVTTAQRIIETPKVILTTGGKSYPGCGTTGDGYGLAQAFGHTIVRPRPALVPLLTPAKWSHELSGITLPDVVVRVIDQAAGPKLKQQILDEQRNSLLFTHIGFSGPAALNISRTVTAHPAPATLQLHIDLEPDQSTAELDEQLRKVAAADGRRNVVNAIAATIPTRVIEQLLKQIGLPPDRKMAELSRSERQRIVATLKGWSFPLQGTLGFEKAEVTAGGVSLAEVDSRTMQSKLEPGLYFAGEILDLDGLIGGYNFQAAFSTGWVAGALTDQRVTARAIVCGRRS